MFARGSTFQPSPGTMGEPTEETVNSVLDLPGCMGIYYLLGESDKSLSITLWSDRESLAGSHKAADQIRSETSALQNLEVLAVEEFEVLTKQIRV